MTSFSNARSRARRTRGIAPTFQCDPHDRRTARPASYAGVRIEVEFESGFGRLVRKRGLEPLRVTRQILSSPRTKNQHFSAVWMLSHSLVNMRVSALWSNSQLNPSKRPLGTILGTIS